MAGLLHSVNVRFTALVGGFVGPIRAAGAATAGFGRTVGGTINTIAGMRGRIDAIGREMTQLQRRMSAVQGNSAQAAAQRRAFQGRLRALADERTMLMRQQAAMQRVGQTATVMGVAMVAAYGLAVKAAMDFDKVMSKVGAVSNATAADMEALRKAALKAGKDTKFSAKEAAQGEVELAKAGIATADILGGALTGALSLAAAGELELSAAATVSAQAMNIFKLSGKDVGHVADVLAAGANKSAADVKGLAWSLKMGGQVAAQTGLTLETTVGVLSAFADNALIGSDAGTSLKTMLQHLAAPSNKASDLMNDLGLEVYDASGNFVGMTQLAANLQKSLQGLTQEERDFAMATIFGSDAVRGANILYKIGAAGVTEYTNAVNDNGAAARTAAMQMDNLAGDLEKLKGSLETALIQSGSGANGVLRGMVKAVDGAVSAYLSLPPAVQSTMFVVIGLTGAVILLAKGMIFMVTTAKEAKIALAALGLTGARVTAAMVAIRGALATTAAFMMGPWGIAVAGAVAILAIFMMSKKKSVKASEELTAAIEADSGALGDNTRATVINELEKRGLLEIAQKLGVSEKDLTDAVLGNEDALKRVNASVMEHSKHMEKGSQDSKDFASNALKLRAGLEGQTGSLKASTEAAKRKATAMGEAKNATKGLTDATGEATRSTVSHAEAEQNLIDVMKSATTTANDLKTAFEKLAEANMTVDRANIAVRKSTVEAAKASDKRKGLTDKEREALIDLADSSQGALVALKDTGIYGDELFAKQEKLAASFIKAARGMGASEAEARALARRYGLLTEATMMTNQTMGEWITKATAAAKSSSEMSRKIGGATVGAVVFKGNLQRMLPVLYAMASGNKALTAQVNELAKASGIASGKMRVSKDAFMAAAKAMGVGTSEAHKLWKEIAKIKSKSATVTINAKGTWSRTNPGLVPEFHGYSGGPVPDIAPGASRYKDSVPSLLRVDEHVWTPEEVDAVGGHGAMYRMRQEARAGRLRGFYSGGGVLTKPGAAAQVLRPIRAGYTDLLTDMIQYMAELWKKAMSGGGVVAAARSQIGLPYSWGGGGSGGPSYGIGRGSGTYGFDCSGLTEYAWWKGRKVHIGGWTGDQIAGSRMIGSPRPGALGFPHPGHVVLYSGNNRVIQAPNTGSFVNEGPVSRSYTWRWPNNAGGYAEGGQVTPNERQLGQDYAAGRDKDPMIRMFGLAGDPGRAKGYADGGRVTGASGLDRLLLAATKGEYMVNADATAKYGPWLDMINFGGSALLQNSVRGGGGFGGGGRGAINIHVHNYAVLGSQYEVQRWLTASMEDLRRKGKLPTA